MTFLTVCPKGKNSSVQGSVVSECVLFSTGYEGKKKPWETRSVAEGRTQTLNKSQTTGKPIKIKDLCNDDRTTTDPTGSQVRIMPAKNFRFHVLI